MKNKPLTISDEAKVQMPMKTVASLIALVAVGGRVLNFVCLSKDFFKARKSIFNTIKSINWTGGFFRKDIGYKVIDK